MIIAKYILYDTIPIFIGAMQSSKDLHLVKILSRLSNDPTSKSKKKSSCTKVEITKKGGAIMTSMLLYMTSHICISKLLWSMIYAQYRQKVYNVFVRKQNTKPKENMTKYWLTITKGIFFSDFQIENGSRGRSRKTTKMAMVGSAWKNLSKWTFLVANTRGN